MHKYLIVLLITLLFGCEDIREFKKYEITRESYEIWHPKHPKIEDRSTVDVWIESVDISENILNKYVSSNGDFKTVDINTGISYYVRYGVHYTIKEL